ncbi:MAG: sigma-70 family RNA polymerase sigma factor [Actinomycetota bacterium]|nr:sigma-70 family RNA polymerase sigma factor [Actinomycetota bacterium]
MGGSVVAVAPAARTAVGGGLYDRADAVRQEWTAFYREEYLRLANAMFTYTADREVACELAQEAMARAWSRWHRVGQLRNPAAWTCRVAMNLANSRWRRLLHARRFDAQHADDEAIAEPDIGVRLAVRQAVAALPRRQKTALVLRYLLDLSLAETAREMGCQAGTVAAMTNQAIEKLRTGEALTDHEGET